MSSKTNAARLLDQLAIPYQLVPYAVDENDLSAPSVAAKIGQPVGQVFKTLVLHGNKTGPFVCIIPGAADLDLKKAAHVSGNKNAALIPLKSLFELTGYVRGGCSPLAMKKKFPTFLDETAILYDHIFVSAGIRGLQLQITPDHLLQSAPATLADLVASHPDPAPNNDW
jgi:Cys-tRNA(Pro)/Cys-tRNA(Cys) deacylase